MPVEVRRIRQHAQTILVEVRCTSIDNFQHHLHSRSIGKAPVHSLRPGINGHHLQFGHLRLHFVDRCTLSQNQRHQLQVADALACHTFIVCAVVAVGRKVEQSGRQPLFVQSLGHEVALFHRQAHISVARRKLHSALAARQETRCPVSAGHNHVATVQVASSPLYSPCHHRRTIACHQSNARTRISRTGHTEKRRHSRQKL